MLDVRKIAGIHRGDVTGRDNVNVPGPGHSPADRSLSIKLLSTRAAGYLQQIAAAGHDRQENVGPTFQTAGRFPVYQIEDLDHYARCVLGPQVPWWSPPSSRTEA